MFLGRMFSEIILQTEPFSKVERSCSFTPQFHDFRDFQAPPPPPGPPPTPDKKNNKNNNKTKPKKPQQQTKNKPGTGNVYCSLQRLLFSRDLHELYVPSTVPTLLVHLLLIVKLQVSDMTNQRRRRGIRLPSRLLLVCRALIQQERIMIQASVRVCLPVLACLRT